MEMFIKVFKRGIRDVYMGKDGMFIATKISMDSLTDEEKDATSDVLVDGITKVMAKRKKRSKK